LGNEMPDRLAHCLGADGTVVSYAVK
jgi:hypothetical protein